MNEMAGLSQKVGQLTGHPQLVRSHSSRDHIARVSSQLIRISKQVVVDILNSNVNDGNDCGQVA